MKKLTLGLLLAMMALGLAAQKKQYDSLMEALMAGGSLRWQKSADLDL